MRQKGNMKELPCWGCIDKSTGRHHVKSNRHCDQATCTSAYLRTPLYVWSDGWEGGEKGEKVKVSSVRVMKAYGG